MEEESNVGSPLDFEPEDGDVMSSDLGRSETGSVLDHYVEDDDDIPDGELDLSPLPSHQSYQQDLEPIIPKGPGQRFALNPMVLAGLSVDSKKLMEEKYEKHKRILSPPVLDRDLVTHYVTAWPTVLRYPSDAQKERYSERHPGLIKELDLVRQHKDLQRVCRPSFELINKLALITNSNSPNKLSNDVIQPLVETAKNTIQIHADIALRITKDRRKNVFNSVSLLKSHEFMIHNTALYDSDECLVHLFGPTFLNNFREAVCNDSSFLRSLRNAQQTRKPDNKGAGYVYQNHTNINLKQGIITEIHKILKDYDLPIAFPGVKFLNLSQVEFLGGRISHFIQNWKLLTADQSILQIVAGHKIIFEETPVVKNKIMTHPSKNLINSVKELLKLKVIETTKDKGVTSNVFLVDKPDGGHRLILNLKDLNKFVPYNYFQMQSLENAILMLKEGDWMIKLDLKKAYDSVPIHQNSRKFLQFQIKDCIFQYRAFPNGYKQAPRLFTLLFKPILALCNRNAMRLVIYLDDSLLLNTDRNLIKHDASILIQTLVALGFKLNFDKSILDPVQRIKFLGLILDSEKMEVSVSPDKLAGIQADCARLLYTKSCTKRTLASLIGSMVAVKRAVLPAPLHYRALQRLLVASQVDWDKLVWINQDCVNDLNWWLQTVKNWISTSIIIPEPSVTLVSDASEQGWGAHCGAHQTRGVWSADQKKLHINVLEILAIHLGMLDLLGHVRNACILIKSDSTNACSYIRKMGGLKNWEMVQISTQIWELALSNKNFLVVQHIQGKKNVQADFLSRVKDRSDFQLNTEVFQKIDMLRGPLILDLFATKWNRQTQEFVSWLPIKEAKATDALKFVWPKQGNYAFPPFGLIPKVIAKIRNSLSTAVLITPNWKTNSWYGQLMQMSIAKPILLPKVTNLLTNRTGDCHVLKWDLVAWSITGNLMEIQKFHQELQNSCQIPEGHQQISCTNTHFRDLLVGVVNGKCLMFHQI